MSQAFASYKKEQTRLLRAQRRREKRNNAKAKHLKKLKGDQNYYPPGFPRGHEKVPLEDIVCDSGSSDEEGEAYAVRII